MNTNAWRHRSMKILAFMLVLQIVAAVLILSRGDKRK